MKQKNMKAAKTPKLLAKHFLILATLVLGIIFLPPGAVAQVTGTIAGTVADQSGAVIARANVALTNMDSKDVRHAVSNDVGFFSFTGLSPATYSVKIESKGFRGWEQKGIVLEAGDRKSVLGISMQISQSQDTTTVEAVASAVEVVDSGDRGTTLTANQIEHLALQGRDVTELVKTFPGFNNFTGNGSVSNKTGYDTTITTITSPVGNGYSGNGAPTGGAISLTADGANVLDPGCNCKGTQTINPEAVQELKVTTAAYGADNAHGPVQIQAIGKSGSSEYHGTLYLHARDAAMNANDWETKNLGLPRTDAHYYYPGATFGGAVPKTGKKLLFFAQYEYYNQAFADGNSGLTNGIAEAFVPTADMRAGNFDPNSTGNAPYCTVNKTAEQCRGVNGIGFDGANYLTPNNQIPSYLLDPNMARYMAALMPLPNVTPSATNGTNNYVAAINSGDNGWTTHERIDYGFNDSNKLFITINLQRDTAQVPVNQFGYAPTPSSLPFGKDGGQVNLGKSQTYSANYVHIFNSSLTNELIGTLGHLRFSTIDQNMRAVSKAGIGWTLPGMTAAGGDSAATIDPMVPSLWNSWYMGGEPNLYEADANGYFSAKWNPGFVDNITKVYKNHTFKAGVSWDRSANNQLAFFSGPNEVGTNGQMFFADWGAAGGNPTANMVVGSLENYNQATSRPVNNMSFWSLGFYGQDVWKLNKHLTLSYGLRVNHDTPWVDTTGKTGSAVWMGDAVYAADYAAGTSDPGVRWHGIDSAVKSSGRSLQGAFYSPRLGFSYDVLGTGKTVLRGGVGSYYFHDSFNDYAAAISVGNGQGLCGPWPWQQHLNEAMDTAFSGCGVSSNIAINSKDNKEPVTYNYSMTLSQQLPGNSVLEIAYSGNDSAYLLTPVQNINAIPLGRIIAADGTIAVDPVTHTTPTLADLEGSGNLPGHYRKYLGYGGAMNIINHSAIANYNAMVISWNHPRGPMVYGINYTWSKTLGINGGSDLQVDPINAHNDYTELNSDRAHVINANYSLDLGNRLHGPLGAALNGWNFSGVIGIQSGIPFQENSSMDLGLSGLSPSTVANNSQKYYLDALTMLGSPDYHLMPQVNCNPAHGMKGQYINPNCYSIAPMGTNGPSKQMVRGPGYWNFDPSLAKSVKISERQSAMFKITAMNLLNHALWSFDSNHNANETLVFQPTANNLTDYTGYNPAAGNSTLTVPTDGSTFGVPHEKMGKGRVLELSVRYSF